MAKKVANPSFIYKAVPHGWPVAGKDLEVANSPSGDFDLEQSPPADGFTTKNLYAAFDPSQRGRMRDPAIKSYSQAMTVGDPVISVSVIGRVLKSSSARVKADDIVFLTSHHTESYSVVSGEQATKAKVLNPPQGVPLTAYLGALGMTGMTAYGSLHEIGQPKAEQVILVSAAAGAVGQMVGQFAVREGLKVYGSVGDDEKLKFLVDELGFAGGFNYKKEKSLDEAVKRFAPDGLDIYYDNVGGELLDVALDNMKVHGRIGKFTSPFFFTATASMRCMISANFFPTVACGSISTYNTPPSEIPGIKNYGQLVRRRIRWEGFLVYDPNIIQHEKARNDNVTKWIQEGSLKSVDHVTEGMENAVEGFLGMLEGKNLGKSILKIAD